MVAYFEGLEAEASRLKAEASRLRADAEVMQAMAAGRAKPSTKEPQAASGGIPREELLHYRKLFESNEAAKGEGLTSEVAAKLLKQVGLPNETLKDVWQLSCEIEDGPLELDGFSVAMHLASRCKKGERLPAVLPSSLRPPFW